MRGTLRKIFERLDRTDRRWLTPGYRPLPDANARRFALPAAAQQAPDTDAGHHDRGDVQQHLRKLCDGFGRQTDGELTMDVTLKAYRMLARMALRLHAMPPHYDALNKTNRRNEPDTELLPGAILRLTCADWWKRKLWLLRCEWRRTTPRRLSGFQKNITPSEPDALSEFRAQREKTRDFLKSFMLENEDGFTIDPRRCITRE